MDKKSVARPRTDATKKTALDHALAYAAEGISVIWIPSGTKAPIEKGWPQLATTDAAIIERWAAEHPGCNFGLVMGNGFVAIDIDDPSRLPELKELGFQLPETRVHRTANGLHFLYRAPDGIKIKNSVKRFGGIVDVRHANAQVVCPGSVHPSGFIYAVDHDSPIAELPAESLAMLTEPEPAKSAAKAASARTRITEGERNMRLFNRARWLRGHGDEQEAIEAKLLELNPQVCDPPLPDDEVRTIARSAARYSVDEAVQAIKESGRPVVLLPSDDRLMSDCAAELGEHLADVLFLFNGEVVALDGSTPRPVSPQLFRTLVEDFAVCARQRVTKKLSIDVHVTMTVEEARGIMASDHFRKKLRPLRRIGLCRLPVLRNSGAIELLPEGYDRETATMTVPDVNYSDDMPFEEAVAVIRDLFSEFEFADGERSLSVAVTALVGLYAAQLVDVRSLRPVYAVTKNAPGAGATLLSACAVVPVLGSMPTGVKPDKDEEMSRSRMSIALPSRSVSRSPRTLS